MGSREGKEQIVSELTEQFKSAQAVVVVDYRGISVAQDTKLRKELRENGVKYVVAKNTLLSIAAKEAGFEGICDTFKGVTSVAFCDKGGILEGEVIDAAKVQALSELPSKEILLAQVASCFQAPIQRLCYVFEEIRKKKEEEATA